ncbi:hypothetical protein AZA_08296 [Nitrospirillum viridazoti Y2]|nr:hypothetical protein AZA_08296 [Nitrospirillum amazonense Y2]
MLQDADIGGAQHTAEEHLIRQHARQPRGTGAQHQALAFPRAEGEQAQDLDQGGRCDDRRLNKGMPPLIRSRAQPLPQGDRGQEQAERPGKPADQQNAILKPPPAPRLRRRQYQHQEGQEHQVPLGIGQVQMDFVRIGNAQVKDRERPARPDGGGKRRPRKSNKTAGATWAMKPPAIIQPGSHPSGRARAARAMA